MEYTSLGKNNIKVSKICFGSLIIGPLQAGMSFEQGGEIIKYAISKGINFIDTAELYGTYGHIRYAIKNNDKVVISTKTYAPDRELAVRALENARRELDRDYIDIFMLHEQESIFTLQGHMEAIDFFLECKEKGLIKAFGVSTHHVSGVKGAVKLRIFDIIHPIFNYKGYGIVDGTIEEMSAELIKAKDAGIGIFAMKPLGGGNLINDAEAALNFAFSSPVPDSIAIGMQSFDEIDANIEFLENKSFSEKYLKNLKQNRKLIVGDWCTGCKSCENVCKNGAITVINGIATCDSNKCLLCGYCGSYCKNFAIKIF